MWVGRWFSEARRLASLAQVVYAFCTGLADCWIVGRRVVTPCSHDVVKRVLEKHVEGPWRGVEYDSWRCMRCAREFWPARVRLTVRLRQWREVRLFRRGLKRELE